MPALSELVNGVDGVREDVATQVAATFSSVEDLAAARKADLQALNGVGPVLATRILEAARAAVGPVSAPQGEELPERMRSAIAEAAEAARPMLDVIDGGRPDETPAADAELPRAVRLVASLVGTGLGLGIRVYRTLTWPVQRLLRH